MAGRRKKQLTEAERKKLLADLRRDVQKQQAGYRAQALKLFPHICASCGREFSDSRLRELTVHHKDHNWKNNPPDGSNWELLCVYCHDHEHEKYKMAEYASGEAENLEPSESIFTPLEGLSDLNL